MVININKIDWKSAKVHQYVLLLSLLLFTVKHWEMLITAPVSMLYLLFGLTVGFLLVYFDKAIFAWTKQKEYEINDRQQWLVELIDEEKDRHAQLMRSWLFVIIILIVAFVVMTSSVSWWVRGFLGGVLFHLLYDLGFDQWRNRLNDWQIGIKLKIDDGEKRILFWIVTVVGGILLVTI